jgi:hypothetical protein
MIGLLQAFGISVGASVIAVAIIAVSRVVWLYMVENYGYRLAFANISDVSGVWLSETPDHLGHIMKEAIFIRQRGTKLTGHIDYEIEFKDGRKPRAKRFLLCGIIRNEIVVFYYNNASRKEIGSGAFCLSLSKDGDILKGKYTWFDVEEEKIIASTEEEYYTWRRSERD